MVDASTRSGRRARWPLVLVWVLALGNLAVIGFLPFATVRPFAVALFGISVGCMVVVFVYARGLRAVAPASGTSTLLLVGGPCDGQRVERGTAGVPTELWMADGDGSLCCYRLLTVRTAGLPTMLFQRTEVSRRVPGL
jgi:hypothetical protein